MRTENDELYRPNTTLREQLQNQTQVLSHRAGQVSFQPNLAASGSQKSLTMNYDNELSTYYQRQAD